MSEDIYDETYDELPEIDTGDHRVGGIYNLTDWLNDIVEQPRRIITSGALRAGKDATTAYVFDKMHAKDDNMEFYMFSPPHIQDDLPDWIHTTLDLNDKRIWGRPQVPKTLWINEGLIALNPQDWNNPQSKLFARKIPISSHKNLRMFTSSQSGDVLSILVKTSNYRIFKRMDMELMESMFRAKVYLRSYVFNTELAYGQGVFQRLSLKEGFLDSGVGHPIELFTPNVPIWYTDRVSKNWEDITDDEIKRISGIEKPDLDYEDLKTKNMNKLDFIALMALHVYDLEDDKGKGMEEISVDDFMTYVPMAGVVYSRGQETDFRVLTKDKARRLLPMTKLLHRNGGCPYCGRENEAEIKSILDDIKKTGILNNNANVPLFEPTKKRKTSKNKK